MANPSPNPVTTPAPTVTDPIPVPEGPVRFSHVPVDLNGVTGFFPMGGPRVLPSDHGGFPPFHFLRPSSATQPSQGSAQPHPPPTRNPSGVSSKFLCFIPWSARTASGRPNGRWGPSLLRSGTHILGPSRPEPATQ